MGGCAPLAPGCVAGTALRVRLATRNSGDTEYYAMLHNLYTEYCTILFSSYTEYVTIIYIFYTEYCTIL